MKKLLFALAVLTAFAFSGVAQTPTGRLVGVVSSPDGGVLPGATVEVKFNQTGRYGSDLRDGL